MVWLGEVLVDGALASVGMAAGKESAPVASQHAPGLTIAEAARIARLLLDIRKKQHDEQYQRIGR